MKRYSALLLLLVLFGVLAISQVATAAASPARPATTFAHPTLRDDAEGEDEFEAEEVEFEFEDCEAAGELEFEFEDEAEEVEFEEEELEEECGNGDAAKASKKGAPFVTAPASCQVRQAESTITTLPAADQVQLTVRYRTTPPPRSPSA